MRTFEYGPAKVNLWLGPQKDVVRFVGVLREEKVDRWLIPLIEQIHREALASSLAEVKLDLRELHYANAAVWRCIVAWIKRVRSSTSGYILRVIADPSRSWQRVALPTLRVFTFDQSGAKRVIIEPDE